MTHLEDLIKNVKQFCEERDWDQFHNPKDLAIGLITEASELLEHFRFLKEEQIKNYLNDSANRQKVGEELADVLFFVLRFAEMNDYDLTTVLKNKMIKNGEKYPVDKARGSNKKYDQL